MTSIKVSKYDLKVCLLSVCFGALLPLSMAPFHWWPLELISIAGLSFLICDSPTTKDHFKTLFFRTFSYGIGVYALGASWIFVSIHEHGGASIALALFLITPFIIFLALLLATPFALLGKALKISENISPSKSLLYLCITTLLVFPSLWVIGEWFRGWAFSGFPWLYLGYAHTDTWLSGWATVAGVLGISWIVAFCGALLGLCIRLGLFARLGLPIRLLDLYVRPTQETRFKEIKIRHKTIVLSGGLSLALLFWFGGAYFQAINWTTPTGKPLSIGLVQPALSLSIKWDPHQLPSIVERYRTDTEKLLRNDLVVWPESAIPRFYHEVTGYLDTIISELNDTHTALITGIPTAENSADKNNGSSNSFFSSYYNSVVGLGQASGTYHKQHLVPFGEYVPFEKWLRGTIAFFDLPMSAFNAGPENQQPISTKGAIIGAAICYEIAYSELVRKSASSANLLLTLSNDTWFGKSIGPKQHFQIARMRAIENGKPLIRATNDGISALITADGKVKATIPPYKHDILEGTLVPRNGLTPFGQYGSLPILLVSFFCTLIALLRKSVWV